MIVCNRCGKVHLVQRRRGNHLKWDPEPATRFYRKNHRGAYEGRCKKHFPKHDEKKEFEELFEDDFLIQSVLNI